MHPVKPANSDSPLDVMKGPVGAGGSSVLLGQVVGPRSRNAVLRPCGLGRAAGHSRGGPTMSNPTRWVGIDLHRRRSFVTAISEEQGELSLQRRIVNDREAFLELLGDPDGTHVALEATYGWEWLADLLEDAGFELHLAHPLRTRAIAAARVKTDAVDARTLAQLLRAGLLPEAYIAPRELRDVRELLRHRVTLVAMRSAIKNRVHAILARHGVTPPARRPVWQSRPTVPSRGRAARGASPADRQPARAARELRPRDRHRRQGDRPAGQRRRACAAAMPDPRRRPLHRDADHRRDRRRAAVPDRAAPVRLGWVDPDGAQL